MAITKERKQDLVAQYKQLIEESEALFLTEYTGLNVKHMQDLRAKVRTADASYHITKNTLLKLALAETGQPVPEELLLGQIGTGFALGEAPSLAKALLDFAKAEERLIIKGGIMEGALLSAEQVEALASLPSVDELRAQLVGLISGPARSVVSTMASGVRQVVNVVDAYVKSDPEAAEASA